MHAIRPIDSQSMPLWHCLNCPSLCDGAHKNFNATMGTKFAPFKAEKSVLQKDSVWVCACGYAFVFCSRIVFRALFTHIDFVSTTVSAQSFQIPRRRETVLRRHTQEADSERGSINDMMPVNE